MMKRTTLKKTILSIIALITVITVFSACTQAKKTVNKDDVFGSLLLSVNPEVKIEYDENGVVVCVKGINKEGKALITDKNAYNGQSCDEAVKDLVSRIYDAGYFVEKVEGRSKNIVIKLEDGSSYPDKDFLSKIENAVRVEVGILGLDSEPISVDESDYDEFGRINADKAKELALTQAGIEDENAVFTERNYDNEDNVYEIEFYSDGVEYELEVDASTGKVREADLELNDDWKKPVSEDTQAPETQVIPEPLPDTDTVVNQRIGVEKAKAVALEYAGVTEAEYIICNEDEDDYDIEFAADGIEYDVEVNAYTGKVSDFDKEYTKKSPSADPVPETAPTPETEPAPIEPAEKISKEKAQQIALEHSGVTKAVRIKCEAERNEYEIEFRANGIEYEYEINAYTGEIISFDAEEDDD